MKAARLVKILKTDDIPWSEVVCRGLHHVDDSVRAEAFSLICSTPKKAEPITENEISLLKHFLPYKYNLNIDDPSFRQRLCADFKKLLLR